MKWWNGSVWLRAYAAATATTASWEKNRDAATSGVANKPAKTTTIAYTGPAGVVALEVKLSATVDDGDVRHLRWLQNQIGDGLVDAAVLTTGPEAYRRKDGIAVVPLVLLGP